MTEKEEALFNVLNDWLDLDQGTFYLMLPDMKKAGVFNGEE